MKGVNKSLELVEKNNVPLKIQQHPSLLNMFAVEAL